MAVAHSLWAYRCLCSRDINHSKSQTLQNVYYLRDHYLRSLSDTLAEQYYCEAWVHNRVKTTTIVIFRLHCKWFVAMELGWLDNLDVQMDESRGFYFAFSSYFRSSKPILGKNSYLFSNKFTKVSFNYILSTNFKSQNCTFSANPSNDHPIPLLFMVR